MDRAPDAASEQQAARVFRKLVELDAENGASFIAQIRLQNGRIWKFDPRAVEQQTLRLNLKPMLEPSVRPDPPLGQTKI